MCEEKLTIRTNNHHYELFSLAEADMSDKQRCDFDYIEREESYSLRLFKYRGTWYDTGDMMYVTDMAPTLMQRYNGYQGDSFFSGVLVRYTNNFETVQVATYLS